MMNNGKEIKEKEIDKESERFWNYYRNKTKNSEGQNCKPLKDNSLKKGKKKGKRWPTLKKRIFILETYI